MEKIVAKRLRWYLEKNNLIDVLQVSFRSRRRTADHHLRLHDAIYKAIANKLSVLTVCLHNYREGVRYGLSGSFAVKLLQLGITGEMFNFIKSFLTNRSFQVRINSSYSEVKNLENGVPQGSVLSPILFSTD